ncbi:hypothetical protein NL676_008859 [Syzygium grande]|nr:hypothetical protein NL676_008859 [Syzygium grande]
MVARSGLQLGTGEAHGNRFTDELMDGAAQRRLVAAGFAMRRQQNHRISSDDKIEKKHPGARNNNSFIEGICNTATGAEQHLECQCRGKSAAGAASSSGWSGEACRGHSRHGGLGSNTSDKLGSVFSLRQQARRLGLAGFVVTDTGSSDQSNNVGVDVKLAARKQRLFLSFPFYPLSCLAFSLSVVREPPRLLSSCAFIVLLDFRTSKK